MSIRNGFWSFESSLLVRPFRGTEPVRGLVEWNDKSLWTGDYVSEFDAVLCFAEDAFGFPYCFDGDRVGFFDPEAGEIKDVARSLGEWAEIVLDDSDFRTGYPLAHKWQQVHGPLMPGTRLYPKVPFVLGGEYELDNLYASDEVEGMLFRASIANQIRDVPDGCQVVVKVMKKSEE